MFVRRDLGKEEAVRAGIVLMELGYLSDAIWLMVDCGVPKEQVASLANAATSDYTIRVESNGRVSFRYSRSLKNLFLFVARQTGFPPKLRNFLRFLARRELSGYQRPV
jgi:hypothetical protein